MQTFTDLVSYELNCICFCMYVFGVTGVYKNGKKQKTEKKTKKAKIKHKSPCFLCEVFLVDTPALFVDPLYTSISINSANSFQCQCVCVCVFFSQSFNFKCILCGLLPNNPWWIYILESGSRVLSMSQAKKCTPNTWNKSSYLVPKNVARPKY